MKWFMFVLLIIAFSVITVKAQHTEIGKPFDEDSLKRIAFNGVYGFHTKTVSVKGKPFDSYLQLSYGTMLTFDLRNTG